MEEFAAYASTIPGHSDLTCRAWISGDDHGVFD
jgi:hypothetical protein